MHRQRKPSPTIPCRKLDVEVSDTKWFKFEEPDSYKIICLYQVELFESDFKLPIWDDHVVSNCTVVIETSVASSDP
jgi:hypothetical protein